VHLSTRPIQSAHSCNARLCVRAYYCTTSMPERLPQTRTTMTNWFHAPPAAPRRKNETKGTSAARGLDEPFVVSGGDVRAVGDEQPHHLVVAVGSTMERRVPAVQAHTNYRNARLSVRQQRSAVRMPCVCVFLCVSVSARAHVRVC
jgi:hypothetical protein